MTPFEIDILLHYYATRSEHPVVALNPPIWPETRTRFIELGLLEPADAEDRNRTYKASTRLVAYAEALQSVPLPQRAWVTVWPTGIEKR